MKDEKRQRDEKKRQREREWSVERIDLLQAAAMLMSGQVDNAKDAVEVAEMILSELDRHEADINAANDELERNSKETK